ncbi:DapH/DapD/GlmU-related protein [Thioalkalicoccus limnaeus]|uniref:DapH/DapD/GlmU-related protein n=1 Tax=Thioalkalicoccus limnaeus TaxID=120681 RepID=A0ABV4BCT3_9GAMM
MPEPVRVHPGIDKVGERTRIAPDVSVLRFGPGGRGIEIGSDCTLYTAVRLVIGDPGQYRHTGLAIGDRVHVNVAAYLSGEGGLTIGDDCLIGPHARLLSAGHEIDDGEPVIARAPLTYGPIAIGCGAWIGAGATLLPGVSIGRGAVVGAGAVVTRSVPDFAVFAGVPARAIRYRRGFEPSGLNGLVAWLRSRRRAGQRSGPSG